ncbi:MAG: DUF3298 and DUF4163 domain-containing protein [Patescibacteria group bacterium]
MKKLFGLVIVIIIAGAAVWLFGNKKPAGEENLGNQENPENQEVALAATGTILQEDSFYNIKANFPQFAKTGAAFNKKIADLITEKVDTFKKDARDTWDARNATLLPGEKFSATPTEPFDFIADWTAKQVNDKYISFIITMYYFSGGAHGNEEVYASNYDVVGKKEITISDFLDSSEENLQKLSDLAVQNVISQLQESAGGVDKSMEKWIKEGAGPKWENYKDFNFNDDSLVIYFQKYQVAAGAFGPVTISLPKDILEQNSIASNYLQ